MTLISSSAIAIALAGIASFAFAVTPPQTKAGQPLPGLTANQAFQFQEGREYYSTPLTVAQGLGPAFNQPSCVSCHETPVGGWGATSVTHFSNLVGGNFDFLAALGGPVMQKQAISDECREFLPLPSVANHVRQRVTPSVLAFGLVEAIPDSAIIALEDPNDSNGDGISGRAHRVQPLESPTGPLRIGRFGWKAQIATVVSFSGDAARTEMGLTNQVVTQETAPNGDAAMLASCDTVPEIEDHADIHGLTFVDAVTAFQRYLAPPPQSPRSGMAGEALFNQVGCVKCHVRAFTTPNDPALETALRNKTIQVYGDFLLHDMGALADGIPDGQAAGVEMKTPPLWNLRTRPVMLHDGSVNAGDFSTKVTAAINAHAGEAAASRTAFFALTAPQRAQVVAFLASLGRDDYDIDGDGLITVQDFSQVILNSADTNVTADEAWAAADLNQNHLLDFDEVEQLRVLLGIASDCNQNSVTDWSEIASGNVLDADSDAIPDECDQSLCTRKAIRVAGSGGAIPENSTGLTKTLVIPALAGNPNIQSMRVTLNINHTWLSDLSITLKRGADAAVTLYSPCGGANDAIGKYLLVDSAWEGVPATLQLICDGTLIPNSGGSGDTAFRIAPGTYRPAQGTAATGFSTMRGQPMAATWTLKIVDNFSHSGDTPGGTLTDWSVEVRYDDPTPTNCDGVGGSDCVQIASTPSLDCDHDGIIDTCQSMALDCDADGVKDRCQIFAGTDFDCNANGKLDSCDIALGTVRDCDNNGTPDSCDIVGAAADTDLDGVIDSCERAFGDLNLDGLIDGLDLALVLSNWGGSGIGDVNGSGTVDGVDLASLLSSWGQSPPWAGPTVSSVSPATGSTAGGTAITITGTSLTGATSVTVGGVAATSVVVVSSTSVTAVTPAGTVGAKSVAVTTPGGTATATNAFTYFAPATISSVSPATGSTAGGTPITITGTNLTGATSVTVGGVAATSVVVVSSTSVTAVTPAGTVGANSVVVTTPNGSATATNAFTYVVPTDGYTVLEQYVDAAVVTNVTMRNAITASGLPWRVRDNGTNIEMLLVPAGTFTMGCSASNLFACDSDESPTHQVTLTQAFYMGRYEVTQAQWTAKMGSNPSLFVPPNYSSNTTKPVESVSWDMIASTGGFMSLTGLRLPTEAEWEYAYRAGTTTAFHSYAAQPTGFNDDTFLENIAWYGWNSGSQTHPVGSKLANGLGLHDMAGNVWEWCQDWYGSYSSASVINPTGPATGTFRLLRSGGVFHVVSDYCRASRRVYDLPGGVSYNNGFRVARTPYPAMSSVSPATGSTAGGTAITITGTSLTGATSVTVGGVAATSVVVVSSTSVTAVTPAGTAGGKSVAVTTPSGTATATNAFTYFAPPTVSSVSPATGSTAGGTAITITGTSLTGATSVTVGGVAATSVVVVSSTSVTAVTPAGTVGAKSVVVTTPNGTATATNAFTYVAPPTISSVSPTSGSTGGGTAITITGTSLTGATSVTVGGAAATSVVVVSSTSVTAVTPAGTLGAKSVAVTTPNGTATATNAFTYVVPTGWYIVLEQAPNAAVVTNVTMRNAIIASGLPWRVQDNGTGIEMLLVPAGTFTMGCSASTQAGCFSDENPTHQVTLTQAFYMGRYEVTQAHWQAKMGSNPSQFQGSSYPDAANRPVEKVSWNLIASGSTSFMSLTGLRLPTEAEWEYAYRAGTTTAFHSYPAQPNGFNDYTLLENIAWFYPAAGQTHAVGGKLANGLGLHDMAGNVWEWCQDWYSSTYYASSPLTNPTGPTTGSDRLLRGGNWNYGSDFCRASRRTHYTPDYFNYGLGFRVVRNP